MLDPLPHLRPQRIENLTKPLSAPGVRAAYGRQLARPGAKPTERFLRCFNYPEESRVTGAEDIPRLGIKAMFFSNVCSAVRREFWEKAGGFPSGIVLCIQANLLGRRDTAIDGGSPRRRRLSNYQYAWYRLLLGQEITRAWRVLRET